MSDNSVITPEIAQRLKDVAEEQMLQRNKRLLFCAVSGSHIWGLSRPESDFDIRGVYSDNPQVFLGFKSSTDTIEFSDGDIDGQFYEVEKFLRMLCNGNGNAVVQALSPIVIYDSGSVFRFPGLAKKAITKGLKNYYRGYAHSQRKRAMSERGSKALIYTYREMFSGLYLMKYNTILFKFQELLDAAVLNGWYPSTGGLLYKYYPSSVGTKISITESEWQSFFVEWEQLEQRLDAEAEKSTLPETGLFHLIDECQELLVQYRTELARNA